MFRSCKVSLCHWRVNSTPAVVFSWDLHISVFTHGFLLCLWEMQKFFPHLVSFLSCHKSLTYTSWQISPTFSCSSLPFITNVWCELYAPDEAALLFHSIFIKTELLNPKLCHSLCLSLLWNCAKSIYILLHGFLLYEVKVGSELCCFPGKVWSWVSILFLRKKTYVASRGHFQNSDVLRGKHKINWWLNKGFLQLSKLLLY